MAPQGGIAIEHFQPIFSDDFPLNEIADHAKVLLTPISHAGAVHDPLIQRFLCREIKPLGRERKMANKNQPTPGFGKSFYLLLLAPLCCGAVFVVPALIGSIGFAAISAFFLNPLVQLAALIIVGYFGFLVWKRKNTKANTQIANGRIQEK